VNRGVGAEVIEGIIPLINQVVEQVLFSHFLPFLSANLQNML
jgi:hypothetical protein